MTSTNRWIVIVVITLILLLILFSILLWRLGLFEFTGANADTKIIAATLALVGALIGSVVTVAGIFLKYSIDQQNIKIQDLEQQRLADESYRNDQRLRVEAAIRAVQSLSTNSGQEVSLSQRTGVLTSLINLGQASLAFALASQMVDQRTIDAQTIVGFIERGLKSGDEMILNESRSLLENAAPTVLIPPGDDYRIPSFPPSLKRWNPELPVSVRSWGVLWLLKQMRSKNYSEWSNVYLTDVTACLATYWINEKDENLRNGVAYCLDSMLDILGYENFGVTWEGEVRVIYAKDIKEHLSKLEESKQGHSNFADFYLCHMEILLWEASTG